jgi:hypothetical protein
MYCTFFNLFNRSWNQYASAAPPYWNSARVCEMNGGTMAETVRQLAAEAGRAARDVVDALRAAGIAVAHPSQRLEGDALRRARLALGMSARRRGRVVTSADVDLSREEMQVRLLRPLLAKGKNGPNRTTALENVWGHGIPDHQKDAAKAVVEEMLRDGLLAEKVSQGRRHVWLTSDGRKRLDELESSHR